MTGLGLLFGVNGVEKLIHGASRSAHLAFEETLVLDMDVIDAIGAACQDASLHGFKATLQHAIKIAVHVAIAFGGAQRKQGAGSFRPISLLDEMTVRATPVGIDQAATGRTVAVGHRALEALLPAGVKRVLKVRITGVPKKSHVQIFIMTDPDGVPRVVVVGHPDVL